MAEVVGRVAARQGIAFYDASADLERAFAGDLAPYYYCPEDTNAHFTRRGLAIYSALVAAEVRKLLPEGP